MKILTVVPIAKGIPRDVLSYFSAKEVPLGTLVTAPFGKRSIQGVVVDVQEVRDLKGSIKQSNFALRNITTIHPETLAPGLFQAAQQTAEFYAQPIGRILETMIPNSLFTYYTQHPTPLSDRHLSNSNIQSIQVPTDERIAMYKTLARENLARHVSTMIIVPTVAHAERLAIHLQTGIDDRMVVLHSKKAKKVLEKNLIAIVEQKNPVVLIATAPYGSLIRTDWDTIIIEESSSSYYRFSFNPIFDMRFFIEQLARQFSSRIIYADTLLDTSIRSRIMNREIIEMRNTWHIQKPEDFHIIDMKEKEVQPLLAKKTFSILHKKTVSKINDALSQQFSVLLLTTRKGLAPVTVCSECGTTVTCPKCDSSLVLHRKKPQDATAHESRIYMCHHCMYTSAPIDRCENCSSWKLTPLGISTESIHAEVSTTFPASQLFVIDGDTTTPAGVSKTIALWHATKNSILIATPIIIPYLDGTDFGCIVSMDSLLSLPLYTGSEQGIHTALLFLEKNTHTAIIQTRSVQHDVMQALSNENLVDFMHNELESRKELHYPPTTVLVKISSEITSHTVSTGSQSFEKILEPWSPDILLKKSKNKGYVILSAIVKIPVSEWTMVTSPIRGIINELKFDCTIEVNPEGIL